jgi:hypothetical protein
MTQALPPAFNKAKAIAAATKIEWLEVCANFAAVSKALEKVANTVTSVRIPAYMATRENITKDDIDKAARIIFSLREVTAINYLKISKNFLYKYKKNSGHRQKYAHVAKGLTVSDLAFIFGTERTAIYRALQIIENASADTKMYWKSASAEILASAHPVLYSTEAIWLLFQVRLYKKFISTKEYKKVCREGGLAVCTKESLQAFVDLVDCYNAEARKINIPQIVCFAKEIRERKDEIQ